MKILFIAGSLEPGRDGVGDYARSLAIECQRFGHKSYLVGLNDPWVETLTRATQSLRLSLKSSWKERASQVRAFVNEIHPDVISLQFVPFSYHPEGLSFALPPLLRTITDGIPVQVMFHELWIGANQGASVKARFVGYGQRKIVEKLLKSLSPSIVHTSNEVYMQLLAQRGITGRLLPMFGSIPIVENRTDVLERPAQDRRPDALRLGLFGAIHPEWSADDLLARLLDLNRPIRFFHVGRIGPGEAIWRDLMNRYGPQFCGYGERSPEEVSQLLLSADLGVATTPLSLISKSSSVATLLEHGLPVIVTRDDIHFRGIRAATHWADRLIPMDDQFLDGVRSLKKQAPQAQASEIAVQFLADIGA